MLTDAVIMLIANFTQHCCRRWHRAYLKSHLKADKISRSYILLCIQHYCFQVVQEQFGSFLTRAQLCLHSVDEFALKYSRHNTFKIFKKRERKIQAAAYSYLLNDN